MRIIAGKAGGHRLKVPKRVARPSTDRLREALFSILAVKVDGARVLDLFAGSGALGIEALSRGAAAATFVEEDGEACRVIGSNLESAGLAGEVRKADVFGALGRLAGVYDLILADPPYALPGRRDLALQLLQDRRLAGRLADEGLLVVEMEAEREPPAGEEWELVDRRSYGSSAVVFYQRQGTEAFSRNP